MNLKFLILFSTYTVVTADLNNSSSELGSPQNPVLMSMKDTMKGLSMSDLVNKVYGCWNDISTVLSPVSEDIKEHVKTELENKFQAHDSAMDQRFVDADNKITLLQQQLNDTRDEIHRNLNSTRDEIHGSLAESRNELNYTMTIQRGILEQMYDLLKRKFPDELTSTVNPIEKLTEPANVKKKSTKEGVKDNIVRKETN